MDLAWADRDVAQTVALLGGDAAFDRRIGSVIDAHEALADGFASDILQNLLAHCSFLEQGDALQKAVGISLRTLQRHRAKSGREVLSLEQSNRTWRFAELFAHAIAVMGSSDAAEAWMQRPAIGLDNRKPLDLLATSAGAEAVSQYLTRLEYGVYA